MISNGLVHATVNNHISSVRNCQQFTKYVGFKIQNNLIIRLWK